MLSCPSNSGASISLIYPGKLRHKIPVGDFKDARRDYGNLWREAICFINPESTKIVPPIYTEVMLYKFIFFYSVI